MHFRICGTQKSKDETTNGEDEKLKSQLSTIQTYSEDEEEEDN